MLSLSLAFPPVFSGAILCQHSCTLSEVREGSSHIFHPLSVSDWMSALVGERREGREREKKEGGDGEVEFWMGGWDGVEIQMQTQEEEENQTKK